MDIFRGDTYDLARVRLRMMRCHTGGLALVDNGLGATSVMSTGSDASVVPIFVDTDSDEAMVDSRHELDRRNPAQSCELTPVEVALIDNLPSYQHFFVTIEKTTEGAPDNSFAFDQSQALPCVDCRKCRRRASFAAPTRQSAPSSRPPRIDCSMWMR